MRLATTAHDGSTAAAILDGDRWVVIADADGRAAFPDVGALLAAGDRGRELAEAAPSNGGPVAGDATLLRPVLQPGAIICVGLNYKTHILEMGRELPTAPALFSKLPRAMTDPDRDIPLPAASDKVDYEGELAVVIGRTARNVPVERALDHVGGYTPLNDVTMRDYQRRSVQWFAGKTWEASTPFGPVVVTPDEAGDLSSSMLRTLVNGKERQAAPIGDLVFGVADLIADISTVVTLEPGDIIATGTPGGVGFAMEPKQFLRDGDVVEVAIDGMPVLRNRFMAA
jgi:acylpyruvate hydrolase